MKTTMTVSMLEIAMLNSICIHVVFMMIIITDL